MNPLKRQNSTSSLSEAEPSSPSKKSKPNSPERDWFPDAELAKIEKEKGRTHEGYAWGSIFPGSGSKDFVYRMSCTNCGKRGVHMSDDCPDKDTEDAKEYRRGLVANLKGYEPEPKNK
ncbi:hypothetical protein ACLB2K_070596 [Fragaria x ananassa]